MILVILIPMWALTVLFSALSVQNSRNAARYQEVGRCCRDDVPFPPKLEKWLDGRLDRSTFRAWLLP